MVIATGRPSPAAQLRKMKRASGNVGADACRSHGVTAESTVVTLIDTTVTAGLAYLDHPFR
jgi:hypothetical protein